MKIVKIFRTIQRRGISMLNYVNPNLYMRFYSKYLKAIGVNLAEEIGYIDPSCQFDGTNYSLISIGEKTTISKEVLILTHDYSLNRGLYLRNIKGKFMFSKPVEIGKNCFIGARVTLLPGTYIGDNCVIGAGSVVKGRIPNNSIVCGNPARVVVSIDSWVDKHIKSSDYIKLE